MTLDSLQQVLFARLIADGKADEPWALHVLAGCEGQDVLTRLLDDGVEPTRPDVHVGTRGPRATVPRAYLRSIQVRGFRGIGPQSSLELASGPGLTIVCGRNGSGKSSFAEALEVLLTGTCVRLHDPRALGRSGWRNLHERQAPFVTASLDAEGIGPVTLSRKWPPDGDLEEGQTLARLPDGTRPLGDLGWDAAVADYRPFLSYAELGNMLEDGRSELHDALLAGLGLEQYEVVRKRLVTARTERDRLKKLARAAATALVAQMEALDDGEARGDARLGELRGLLSRRDVDLDAVGRLVMGVGEDDPAVGWLRAVCLVTPPDEDEAYRLTGELRAAHDRVQALERMAAGRTRKLADLLDRALDVTGERSDATCPVCRTEGVIDERWRLETSDMVARLRTEAREADAAAASLGRLMRTTRDLCSRPPAFLVQPPVDVATLGLDLSGVCDAWQSLAAGGGEPDAVRLATHVEAGVARIARALSAVQANARDELSRREDVWLPVAVKVADWLPAARQARNAAASMPALVEAESWLKTAIDAIRSERFDPIVQQAVDYWSHVRLHSNVDLLDITLTGAGNRRGVVLDVSVDGADAPALGVMSQGELNCLALSLFLPRATLPDSPFGFVLVDDPVQAMDPAKVEGLARVFARAAATHQVIVFTHDDRLPEAVRRLGLDARFLDVSRREGSVVAVRRNDGPVDTCLEDATAVRRTPGMPSSIVNRLVPGFCRAALEAACVEAVRTRRLGRGDPHGEVEALLAEVGGLRRILALALFDGTRDEGQVEVTLRNSRIVRAVETFRSCLTGAHGSFDGDAEALIADTRRLAVYLRGRGRTSAA